jgi:hypothetical protein
LSGSADGEPKAGDLHEGLRASVINDRPRMGGEAADREPGVDSAREIARALDLQATGTPRP